MSDDVGGVPDPASRALPVTRVGGSSSSPSLAQIASRASGVKRDELGNSHRGCTRKPAVVHHIVPPVQSRCTGTGGSREAGRTTAVGRARLPGRASPVAVTVNSASSPSSIPVRKIADLQVASPPVASSVCSHRSAPSGSRSAAPPAATRTSMPADSLPGTSTLFHGARMPSQDRTSSQSPRRVAAQQPGMWQTPLSPGNVWPPPASKRGRPPPSASTMLSPENGKVREAGIFCSPSGIRAAGSTSRCASVSRSPERTGGYPLSGNYSCTTSSVGSVRGSASNGLAAGQLRGISSSPPQRDPHLSHLLAEVDVMSAALTVDSMSGIGTNSGPGRSASATRIPGLPLAQACSGGALPIQQVSPRDSAVRSPSDNALSRIPIAQACARSAVPRQVASPRDCVVASSRSPSPVCHHLAGANVLPSPGGSLSVAAGSVMCAIGRAPMGFPGSAQAIPRQVLSSAAPPVGNAMPARVGRDGTAGDDPLEGVIEHL